MSNLRRISYRYPSRSAVKKAARVERGKYKCAHCGEIHRNKDVQVDHIEPVVDPHKGFENWDTYIARLFVEPTGLQVLCIDCHSIKTQEENVVRREIKLDKSTK